MSRKTIRSVGGEILSVRDWVMLEADEVDRDELRIALGVTPAQEQGPATLAECSRVFSALCREDKMAFIESIRTGLKTVEGDLATIAEEKAIGDAWGASIADAKARAEQAAREVQNA